MSKLFSHIVLYTKDLGTQKYSVEEIAERMKPTEHFDQEGLIEFASTVNDIFEDKSCMTEDKESSLAAG